MCWIHQICRDAHHLTLSSCCKISPLDSWRGELTHQTTLPRHIWSLAAHNRSHWNTPIGVVKKQPRHLVSWGRNFLTTTADVGQNIGITNLYLHNVNKVDFKSTDNDNSVHWSKYSPATNLDTWPTLSIDELWLTCTPFFMTHWPKQHPSCYARLTTITCLELWQTQQKVQSIYKGHLLYHHKNYNQWKICMYICILQYNENPEITSLMKLF